jgi:iron complex transport system substrate-binding protein
LAAATIAACMFAACGSSSTQAPVTAADATTANAGHYPVAIDNCATKITFDSAPTRAVSNDINTTEDMLALGLQKSMVGDFGVNGDGPDGKPIPREFAKAFSEVRDVSPSYFTLEPLVGLRPDFLFAGWNYGLQTGTQLTPAGLAKFGIKTLALTESCAHIQRSRQFVSIDDTYQDLQNLGEIFDVKARANALVDRMKAQVAAVRKNVAGLKPVTVFDYDSGTAAPFTGPGLAMPTAIIALAGGRNIFASLKQTWTTVSWEQVAKAQPQCIIINGYGTPTWQQKLKFLRSFSATKNLPAIRNDCVIPLTYDEVTPSPRNAQAVTTLARILHPSAFGRPSRIPHGSGNHSH